MENRTEGNGPVNPIRVLLGDDHTMFREGLASLLASERELKVVGSTNNDSQVVELAKEKKPDVVVMQIETPIDRARKNVQEILDISPSPKIAVVTMFANPYYVRDMLKHGASGYLMKSASAKDLVDAIKAVVADHRDPEESKVIVGIPREKLQKAEGSSGHVLTDREMEILLMAARGFSNARIAKSLNIQETTVKRHLSNIYQKMNTTSRGEAVSEAIREGWISLLEIAQATEGVEK